MAVLLMQQLLLLLLSFISRHATASMEQQQQYRLAMSVLPHYYNTTTSSSSSKPGGVLYPQPHPPLATALGANRPYSLTPICLPGASSLPPTSANPNNQPTRSPIRLHKLNIQCPIKQHAYGTKGSYRCILVEQKTLSADEFKDIAEVWWGSGGVGGW